MQSMNMAPSEREAWLSLVALVQLLPPVLDGQMLRDSAATHFEFFVLYRLAEAPDHRLRLLALAQATHASLSRLSHVMTRLEKRGLVTRTPCPEDGRASNATLTASGKVFIEQATPKYLDTVRSRVFAALSRRQIDQLASISKILIDQLAYTQNPTWVPGE